MNRRWVARCVSGAVLALCVGAPSGALAKLKVAVLDVQTNAVPAELAPVLTEVLTTEVVNIEGVEAVSSRDILQVIGFEKQKELLGCSDVSCLAELGGSLGVDRILVTNVGRLGETYVVSMKLINIRAAQVEDRVYQTVSDKVDRVLEVIKSATVRLLEKRARATLDAEEAAARAVKAKADEEARAKAKVEAEARAKAEADTRAKAEADARASARAERAAAPQSEMESMSADMDARGGRKTKAAPAEPVEREKLAKASEPTPEVEATAEKPGRRVGKLTLALWGVGAAGIVTGATFYFVAKGQAGRANDRMYVGSQLEADKASKNERVAFIGLGVGLAAVAGGVVTWLVSGPGAAAPSSVALVPVAGPGALGAVLHATF